ncbi:MAG: hypothetical protein HC830_08685, partial [Bacteroidetes bacterium]|nr:hypothetical protein [Bacteroidota bacterium]
MIIGFSGNTSIIIRCYNDGAAFRFGSTMRDSVVITKEHLGIGLSSGFKSWFPAIQPHEGLDRFHTSFEENYKHIPVGEITSVETAFVPVLLHSASGTALAITESDVQDYPGMFITGSESAGSLQAIFPPYPNQEKVAGETYKQTVVSSRETYLAKTAGKRLFP